MESSRYPTGTIRDDTTLGLKRKGARHREFDINSRFVGKPEIGASLFNFRVARLPAVIGGCPRNFLPIEGTVTLAREVLKHIDSPHAAYVDPARAMRTC
jgi:hypothetical protein